MATGEWQMIFGYLQFAICYLLSHIECPNPFRPIYFVSRKRHEIYAESVHVAIEELECLRGIGVEKWQMARGKWRMPLFLRFAICYLLAEISHDFRNFRDRLNRSDFIVRIHDGN